MFLFVLYLFTFHVYVYLPTIVVFFLAIFNWPKLAAFEQPALNIFIEIVVSDSKNSNRRT